MKDEEIARSISIHWWVFFVHPNLKLLSEGRFEGELWQLIPDFRDCIEE